MPHVTTMQTAGHYFGKPVESRTLDDGTMRHEWKIDRETTIPGHYRTVRTRRFFMRWDEFPEYVEREVFIPSHQVRQHCRLVIFSDGAGQVLQSVWEGDSCDQMPIAPITY